MKIYIDGVEDVSANYSGGIGTPISFNTYIGRMGFADIWHHDGKIDDVRIYNRALNANEVANLYDLTYITAAPDCSGLGAVHYNDSTTGRCYYRVDNSLKLG